MAYPLLVRRELRAGFPFRPVVPVTGDIGSVFGHVEGLLAVFVALLGMPQGLVYLALDATLVAIALLLWAVDGYPGLPPLGLRPGTPTPRGCSHGIVFFAHGPGVEAGASVPDASVVDLAPTVLHALGEPVPAHVDGRVLDVFAPDSEPESRAVATAASATAGGDASAKDSGMEGVEDRLRGLGYLE